MLCLTALALFAAPARAGSYAVSYSGGTYTDGSGNTQTDTDDGGGDYGAGPAASVQGTITVTCTWVPDDPNDPQADPPPQNVVLDETGYAYWEAEGGTTTDGGSCSDGLGDPAVPNTDSLPYLTSGSPQLANDHYTALPGGASFTFTRSPSVSSGGDNQGIMIYSVSISPINLKVKLSGVESQDGGQVALTGQKITATLDDLNGNPYPAQSYKWSASGDVFKTYDPTLRSNQLVRFGPGDGIDSRFDFYDKTAETVTVTCNASIQLPDGTYTTVSVQSDPVTVLKPTVDCDIWTGYARKFDSINAPNYDLFGLVEDPLDPGTDSGEDWMNAGIDVPSPFSGGMGCFAQLITPDREVGNGTTIEGVPGAINGTEGLDNRFPISSWALPNLGNDGDSPNIPIIQGLTGVTGDYWTADDNFRTWIMYQPTAGVWVPLAEYGWEWSGTVSWLNSQWQLTAGSPDAFNEPAYQFAPTSDPPEWDFIHTNGRH